MRHTQPLPQTRRLSQPGSAHPDSSRADQDLLLTPASFLADTGICAAVVGLFLAPLIAIALY